jgi:hypothetical protein
VQLVYGVCKCRFHAELDVLCVCQDLMVGMWAVVACYVMLCYVVKQGAVTACLWWDSC